MTDSAHAETTTSATNTTKTNVALMARNGRITGLRHFTGPGAEVRAYRFGQWFIAGPLARLLGDAVASPRVSGAQWFCRTYGVALVRAQSARTNEGGGFLVPQEFVADFIDLRERFGVFRRNARVVRMKSATQISLRRKGGLKAYPIGAADRQMTESQARWDGIHLEAQRWGVLTKYEAELSEDSITNFGDELAGEMAYAFAQSEDECGFIGDATSRYHGIAGVIPRLVELDANVGNVAGLVEATGATWDSITREDMRAVVGRLPEYADTQDTKWYCSRKFYADVMMRIMLDASGVTAAQLESMRVKLFMGYPVEVAQVLPKQSAAAQVPCVFGDLRQAARFGDRKELTVDVTDSNRTEFEEDLLTIKGIERFDINVHDVGNASADEAKREAGPVVGLITKSS